MDEIAFWAGRRDVSTMLMSMTRGKRVLGLVCLVGSAQATAYSPVGAHYVFFEKSNSNVPIESYAVLDNLIAAYNQDPRARIYVEAGTDRSGSTSNNLRLSCERARAVKAYLEQHAIRDGVIVALAYGEVEPLDGASGPYEEGRSRRVMITFPEHEGDRQAEWQGAQASRC